MECVWTTWLQGYDNLSEEALVDFVRLSIGKKKEKTCESKIRDLLATIYMSMLQQSIDKKKSRLEVKIRFSTSSRHEIF